MYASTHKQTYARHTHIKRYIEEEGFIFVSWWGGNGGKSLRLHNQILSEQAADLGKVGQSYAYISLCAEVTFVTQRSCLES